MVGGVIGVLKMAEHSLAHSNHKSGSTAASKVTTTTTINNNGTVSSYPPPGAYPVDVSGQVDQEQLQQIQHEMQELQLKQHHLLHPPFPPPPKLDPDMMVLAEAFGLSRQTQLALCKHDASTLEDFALMTDVDLDCMLGTEARLGRPFPPLQQRKISILLEWIQELVHDYQHELERMDIRKKRLAMVSTSKFQHSSINDKENLKDYSKKESKDKDDESKQAPHFFDRLLNPKGTLRQATKHKEKKSSPWPLHLDDLSISLFSSHNTKHHEQEEKHQSEQKEDEIQLQPMYKKCLQNVIIPPYWKEQFHLDLPSLKQRLLLHGETKSWFLLGDGIQTIRWILCGVN